MEIIILALALIIYFLPTFIGQDKVNASGIIILNLFLGWTLIGWVAALIWAVESKKS